MKTANLKSATIAALLGIGLLTGCTNQRTLKANSPPLP